MNKTLSLLILALPLLGACSSSETANTQDKSVITSNDFESLDGWIPTSTGLTREQAHSGKFSTKVDGATEYSLGYNNMMGKMHPSRMRKLKLKAWVYLNSGKSQARLSAQIVDPITGQEVFSDGINLTDQVKSYKKWVEVSKDITVPETITATQIMKLFLWRAGATEAAYLDDITLSVPE